MKTFMLVLTVFLIIGIVSNGDQQSTQPFLANTPLHWRLVAEQDYDGRAVSRTPFNHTLYEDPNACIKDGNLLPPPPQGDQQHTSYLIRCLPYHLGQDTATKTPI